ncbi:MAG: ABC transporter permease [Zhongshania sp.]|uniref:ABC transporter permease n=1 Tax=Zhongshania sp. TaxID=1971902 RepID=UPI00263283D1|nr:ABC transporter permease [Zhongshania sp.]MDF1691056.1 ABC transporter permease [Zhongshania sp.]
MELSVFRFARRTWASDELEHIAPLPLPKMATPAVVVSTLVVIALLLFVSVGPLLWRQDPSQQWLSQISAGPSAPHSVRLILNSGPWQPPAGEPPQTLMVHEANTEFVRLQWPKLDGVKRYRVYRASAHKAGLGLAIAETDKPYYQDQLQLSYQIYRYTIADADTGLLLLARDVRPDAAMSLFEAQLQGLVPVGKVNGRQQWLTLPGHPLGTDALGRDILARLMAGGRTSLFVGVVAPLLYITFGCIFGAIAGLAGGWVDQLAMRFVDFVVALPFLLFMILFRVAFGIGPGENGITPLIVAMLMLSWPGSARLIRGQVLALRSQPFVEAAKLAGVGTSRTILRHMLPNVLPMILVAFSFAIPQAIFTEAFLSFIGMGVSPPTTSWGALCNDGIKTLLSHPRQLLLPALFISVSVLAFNLLGDALRDATDRRAGVAKA